MNLFFLLLPLWILIAAFDYAEFCYIWQLKEYRIDRFRDYLSTISGKDFLKSYLVSGRMFLLVLLFLVAKFEISAYFIVLILIIDAMRLVYKFHKRQLRYPRKTLKAALIVLGALVIEGVIYRTGGQIGLLIVFALRFFVLSGVVSLFFVPTKLGKMLAVWLAQRKLKNFPKLRVIGITGSYGKTTVKTFLKLVLENNFKVVATPKNINTEIGVAKFILQTDFSDEDIFIVEMGAYNMGEIKTICDMVHPEIGILTAINEQHLSLFGSIENIQKAKYELLFSLPANGLAIVNSDNEYCRQFLPELACEIETFGSQKEFFPTFLIKNIGINKGATVDFTCAIFGQEYAMTSNVIGKHNVANIAPCVLVAQYLGVEMSAILTQINKLELPDGTLKVSQFGKALIIDDSYNANPNGFLAALDVLDSFPSDRKKIVITRGMIELGEKSAQLHKKVGSRIAEVADELVVISSISETDLLSGIGQGKMKVFSKYELGELLAYVTSFKDSQVVILLENRIPSNVLEALKKK